MTAKRAAIVGVLTALAAVLAWALFVGAPRWAASRRPAAAPSAASAAAAPGRKIKARLFYVAEDGEKLAGADREVPYGDGPAAQAKEIIDAQLAAPAAPLVSAIPAGSSLRAIYVTPQGDAYVDLSSDLVRGHPGGTLNELLTVYTIVDALAVNLPAVSSVQILVDGKQVDTLVGHVDLRRPLAKNLEIVE